MSILVELDELEAIGAKLSAADPGDHDQWARLLARRAELLDKVTSGIPNTPTHELEIILQRLTAISTSMATPYRSVILERLLTLQKMATLAQQKAALAAFSPAPTETEPGRFVRTSG